MEKKKDNLFSDGSYYNRTMSEGLLKYIQDNHDWLIDYVKNEPSLDFQTGHDPQSGRSWFSIYRGTSRILSFACGKKGCVSIKVDDAYRKIAPLDLFEDLQEPLFNEYVRKIEQDSKFFRYYADASDSNRKEGYYQNLIGRRYTFNGKQEDDFIIIDKEFVLGFNDEESKKIWNQNIKETLSDKIIKFREIASDKSMILPQVIKYEYAEFDFLALNKRGDILILELKQDDPAKTALSPVQVYFYYLQFKKLLENNKTQLYSAIKTMVEQKMKYALIHQFEMPNNLSGEIIPCVIVGEENGLSQVFCERYSMAKNHFLPNMKAYTCEKDGSLVISSKLL